MRVFRRKFDRFRLGYGEADVACMLDEHAGGGFPTMRGCELDAGLARDAQRLKTGRAQVIAEHADGGGADDIARPLHRKGRDLHGEELAEIYAACDVFVFPNVSVLLGNTKTSQAAYISASSSPC